MALVDCLDLAIFDFADLAVRFLPDIVPRLPRETLVSLLTSDLVGGSVTPAVALPTSGAGEVFAREDLEFTRTNPDLVSVI